MQVLGEMILGHRTVKGQGGDLFARAAHSGEQLAPAFGAATEAAVAAACELADAAFDTLRELPESLKNGNPLDLWRLRGGEPVRA